MQLYRHVLAVSGPHLRYRKEAPHRYSIFGIGYAPRVLRASGVPLLSLRPVFLMRGTIDGLIAQGTRSMKNTSSDRSRKSPQRYIP